MFRILIKNGYVIDPSQNINEKMDIGLADDIIEDCEQHLSSSDYDKVIDATDKLVIPGLIDIHTHVAPHITPALGVNADQYCLPFGTTTAVDAGSIGELTIKSFKEFIVNTSLTTIYSFINAESLGMIEFPQEETEEKWPNLITQAGERYYNFFTNDKKTIKAIKENPDLVVGIKWAHHGRKSLKWSVDLARKAGVIIMLENHHMPESLNLLQNGDIITHIYHKFYNKLAGKIDGLTDEDGRIHNEFFKAYKNGVIFDLGHGSGSFSWEVAKTATSEGLFPHVISTDLWRSNINGPVFNLPLTMSKLLYLGMPLEDIIRAVTHTPAKILKKEKEIGTLRPGAKGGVVIMDNIKGSAVLVDSYGDRKKVENFLFPNTTIYRGKIITT